MRVAARATLMIAVGWMSCNPQRAGTLRADDGTAALIAFEKQVSDAYEKVRRSVVRIVYEKKYKNGGVREESYGTGVIVTPKGHVLTVSNARFPVGEKLVVYLAGGQRRSGTALGWSEEFGIRLVKLDGEGPWPHVPLRSDAKIQAGQPCIGLSYPRPYGGVGAYERQPALTVGAISVCATRWLASSCRFGEFGEVVVDLDGRLLGVTTIRDVYALDATRDSVHTRADVVAPLWDDLLAGKNLDRLRLVGVDDQGPATKLDNRGDGPPLLDRAKAATVRIRAEVSQPRLWSGQRLWSGVLVSAGGYVVTCAHTGVVPGEAVKVSLPDGREAVGTVVGSHRVADICLVKLKNDGPWPYAEMGRSFDVQVDDKCLLLGYPGDYAGQAALVREGKIVHPEGQPQTCQLHSTILNFRGGDSGGGIFDAQGRLIAIHRGARGEHAYHARVELFRGNWAALLSEKPIHTAKGEPLEAIRGTLRPLATKVSGSTVTVLGDGKPVAIGTIVANDGRILTKASELYGEISCRLPDGRTLPATVGEVWPERDLAVLRVQADGWPVVRWAEAEKTSPGQLLAAVLPGDSAVVSVISHDARPIPAEPGTLLPINILRDNGQRLQIHANDQQNEFFLSQTPFRQGDILVDVEGNPTPDLMSYRELLTDKKELFAPAGAPIRVRVERDGKRTDLRVPLPGPIVPTPPNQSRRCSGFGDAFDTHMPLTPQLCGAPVIGSRGDIIGVAIAVRSGGQVHVIPASVVKDVLSIRSHRSAK
jgi:S1-C subfamily serine protease